MKRHTLAALVQLVGLFGFAIISRSEELLVTSPGRYTATGGCLSVEVKLPDPEHINFKIEWKLKEIDNMGRTIGHEWSQGFFDRPVPVIQDRWAFCMVGFDELWFYDGRGGFMYRKGTSNGLGPNMCPDPKIGEQAPKSLKQWVSKKSRTLRSSELPPADAVGSRSP